MTSEHDPAGAAKEAAAVQAVELAGTLCLVVIAVVIQVVQRQASDPDLVRTWRMRAAKTAEGRLARLGIWALAHAERQRQAYERLTADGR